MMDRLRIQLTCLNTTMNIHIRVLDILLISPYAFQSYSSSYSSTYLYLELFVIVYPKIDINYDIIYSKTKFVYPNL